MKTGTKLVLVGGLAAIVAVAYLVKTGTIKSLRSNQYGLVRSQPPITQSELIWGNKVEPSPYIHSNRSDIIGPPPHRTYSGFVPQYSGWAFNLGTQQATGAPSGAGGLGGGGVL